MICRCGVTRLSLNRFVDYTGIWNKYSQFGEDAVTSNALHLLGIKRGYVVEFGAGDGLHLSNTAMYWHDSDWSALLIEASPERYAHLMWNISRRNAAGVNAFITPDGQQRIDNYLSRDVDLMSIDVDDCDYQIFENLEARPKLVLIEFNHTMPHHLELVGEPGSHMQSSPLALVRLAERKGYALLSITGCNCLFVRNDLLEPFEHFNRKYEDLVNPHSLTYMVSDWHGRYTFVGPKSFGMLEELTEPNFKEL